MNQSSEQIHSSDLSSPHSQRARQGFALVDLLVLLALMGFLATIAIASTGRPSMARCVNNFRQLASAWAMYNADNRGFLPSSYPAFNGFTNTWCGGNAADSSGMSYVYTGADSRGIMSGSLWPYIKSLTPYKCPSDERVMSLGAPFAGQPVLRSVSMNSYMAGTSYGVSPQWTITTPDGPRNPDKPVYLKETEISRPASIFVFIEEDNASINDGMFLVDMGGSMGLLDCMARRHETAYNLSFADTHIESIPLVDPATFAWTTPIRPKGADYRYLTNITTAPLVK